MTMIFTFTEVLTLFKRYSSIIDGLGLADIELGNSNSRRIDISAGGCAFISVTVPLDALSFLATNPLQ